MGSAFRGCCRTACPEAAVATFTYDYAAATVALGPLSPEPETHGYDLCALHARGLSAPVGWQVVRYLPHESAPVPPEAASADSTQATARPGLTQ